MVLLLVASVIFIYPFIWSVSASLKPREDVFDNKLIPTHWQFWNYLDVFRGVKDQAYTAPFAHWFFNSMYIGILAAVTVTISSALVAFAFAYFRFPLPQLPLRLRARDDDAAGRGADDPALPDLEHTSAWRPRSTRSGRRTCSRAPSTSS